MKMYYVYILTDQDRGVLYTGITKNLVVRIDQLKRKVNEGFTDDNNADKLVWFEAFEWVWEAIAREKEIKGWKRDKKIALIESTNPQWEDLYQTLLEK